MKMRVNLNLFLSLPLLSLQLLLLLLPPPCAATLSDSTRSGRLVVENTHRLYLHIAAAAARRSRSHWT